MQAQPSLESDSNGCAMHSLIKSIVCLSMNSLAATLSSSAVTNKRTACDQKSGVTIHCVTHDVRAGRYSSMDKYWTDFHTFKKNKVWKIPENCTMYSTTRSAQRPKQCLKLAMV